MDIYSRMWLTVYNNPTALSTIVLRNVLSRDSHSSKPRIVEIEQMKADQRGPKFHIHLFISTTTICTIRVQSTFLRITAQAAAPLRPFSMSTQKKITTNEHRHKAKRKGNPIQLLPDPSMIA